MKVAAPIRVSHTWRQRLAGSADEVFPLLCPVRERDWVPGWEPSIVWSHSGVAEPECVFLTPSPDGSEAVWVVTAHDPAARHLGLTKVVPGTVVTLVDIRVAEAGPREATADVRYTHVAIGPAGEEIVAAFDQTAWGAFMTGWEDAMNAWLQTGTPANPVLPAAS